MGHNNRNRGAQQPQPWGATTPATTTTTNKPNNRDCERSQVRACENLIAQRAARRVGAMQQSHVFLGAVGAPK
ncbi:hypothetical protein, partial [Actinomadura luteofluorescens]